MVIKPGTKREWLHSLIGHQGDACIMWIGNTHPTGYGYFGYTEDGVKYFVRAHRYMCRIAHGEPPTDKPEAAHSCGKAGCINPKHLSWKTSSENKLDCRGHGTQVRNPRGNRPTITDEQVAEMRSLAGTMTQAKLAARYGISEKTVWGILHGRSRAKPRSYGPALTRQQVEQIRRIGYTMSLVQMAEMFHCGPSIIHRVRRGKSYTDL